MNSGASLRREKASTILFPTTRSISQTAQLLDLKAHLGGVPGAAIETWTPGRDTLRKAGIGLRISRG